MSIKNLYDFSGSIVVLNEESGEEEIFTVDDYIEAYGIDSYENLIEEANREEELKKVSQTITDRENLVERYCDALYVLVKACGRLASSQKFGRNMRRVSFEGPSDHPLWEVSKKYSSFGKIEDIEHKMQKVKGKLDIVNGLAKKLNQEPLDDELAQVLIKAIVTVDAKDREKIFYRLIKKYKKLKIAFPPKALLDNYFNAK